MIVGGGNCAVFAPIADLLADTYTVLTYDRRGNSRCLLHDGPVKIKAELDAANKQQLGI